MNLGNSPRSSVTKLGILVSQSPENQREPRSDLDRRIIIPVGNPITNDRQTARTDRTKEDVVRRCFLDDDTRQEDQEAVGVRGRCLSFLLSITRSFRAARPRSPSRRIRALLRVARYALRDRPRLRFLGNLVFHRTIANRNESFVLLFFPIKFTRI